MSSQHHLYRPYTSTLFLAGLTSLTECREQRACKFFDSTVELRLCLRHLVPSPCDSVLLSHLQAPSKFPHIPSRTKKNQPFISYALSEYQTS